MDSLLQDVRYAVRGIVRNPGFAIVATLTLAIGIGANTTIFSAIDALLLHPIGVRDADRVVAITVRYERPTPRTNPISPTVLTDVRSATHVFATAAMATREGGVTYQTAGFPERLQAARITWEWFDVFGAKPIHGRLFTPEEDQPNANRVVILEYGTWRRLFGGEPAVIGTTIQLDELPHRIVGIMGPEFRRPSVHVWLPIGLPSAQYSSRNRFNESYEAFARLQPGISPAQAQAFLQTITARVRQDPDTATFAASSGWSVAAIPFIDYVAGDTKKPMLMLMGAVAFVLLIACSNSAGLALARAAGRQTELGTRTALGATRWRLVQQILAESLVIAVVGALLGLAVTAGGIQILRGVAPLELVDGLGLQMNSTVLAFLGLSAAVAAIATGALPAWKVAKGARGAIRDSGRSRTSTRAQRSLRSALVTVEVALAVVLLVGASLFLRSLTRLQRVDPGFRSEHVMTGMIELPRERYSELDRRATFYRDAIAALSRMPGVTRAAAGLDIPFSGHASGAFLIEGRARSNGPTPRGDIRWISPEYLSAMGIELKQGRAFTDQDTTATEPVAIIDEKLAKQYWPQDNPIGKRIRRTLSGAQWSTIVGVVGHLKHSELADDSDPGVHYYPIYQYPPLGAALVAKGQVDVNGVALREAVRSVDRAISVFDLKTMDERVLKSIGPRRFTVTLLMAFAGIAMFLAAIGIYGVINYDVRQRTNEIGVRMAMGADSRGIVLMVLRQTLTLAGAGLVLGVLGAIALTRTISTLLYDVTSTDPVSFAAASICLLLVAMLAGFFPARRAARVDPLVALRCD